MSDIVPISKIQTHQHLFLKVKHLIKEHIDITLTFQSIFSLCIGNYNLIVSVMALLLPVYSLVPPHPRRYVIHCSLLPSLPPPLPLPLLSLWCSCNARRMDYLVIQLRVSSADGPHTRTRTE